MHKLIVAATLATIVGVSLYQMSAPTLEADKDRAMFNKWLMQNGKAYGNDDEKEYRFQNFRDSVRQCDCHDNADYELGLNEFADLSDAEFIAQHTGYSEGMESTDEKEAQRGLGFFLGSFFYGRDQESLKGATFIRRKR